ncbi:MAG: hypothetical protein GXO93_05405 [FCB group bacterium]|nr:hypothetical protein [FCB group bacterium]
MKHFSSLIIALIIVSLVACSSNKKNSQPTAKNSSATQAESSGIPFDLNGKPVSIAGITFTPASQWKDLGPSGMRKANYTFGPLKNDADSATLAVFYFGKTGGGSIKANLERWIGQMSSPDTSASQKNVTQSEITVDGMKVHILKVTGTYNAFTGGMMTGKTVPKENYLMDGVVLEAPEGNLFFKLTGPEYTANVMSEAFMAMIKAIKKNK